MKSYAEIKTMSCISSSRFQSQQQPTDLFLKSKPAQQLSLVLLSAQVNKQKHSFKNRIFFNDKGNYTVYFYYSEIKIRLISHFFEMNVCCLTLI